MEFNCTVKTSGTKNPLWVGGLLPYADTSLVPAVYTYLQVWVCLSLSEET